MENEELKEKIRRIAELEAELKREREKNQALRGAVAALVAWSQVINSTAAITPRVPRELME